MSWIVAMGNAASCKACGSARALKTKGSDSDSDQRSDYYKVADSGPEVDDVLVREGNIMVLTIISLDIV